MHTCLIQTEKNHKSLFKKEKGTVDFSLLGGHERGVWNRCYYCNRFEDIGLDGERVWLCGEGERKPKWK